ncbi:MAG: hypothetical protein V3R25_10190 [Nitrosomonadaceae bacterium]
MAFRLQADISNDGGDIVVKSTLTSVKSITNAIGAKGSIVGSPVFDSVLGMNTFAGSALFEDLVGNSSLDTQGQIVITATTIGIAQLDNGSGISGCSGSEGANRSGGATLWASGDGTTATQARCRMAGSETIMARTATADTELSEQSTTLSKPSSVKVCLSWTATTMRLIVDSVIIDSGVRVGSIGDFLDIAVGAARSATETFNRDDQDLYLKDFVVSTLPVELNASPYSSLGFFGDSFAALALSPNGFPRLDGALAIAVTKFFVEAGFEPPATIGGIGMAGFSLCDAVGSAGNLVTEFANFAARNDDLVFLLAANNDVNAATDLEVSDPTTGTQIRGEEFLAAITSATKVIVFDVGSLDNDTNFSQPEVNDRRDDLVNPALKALESDSRVTVFDTSSQLGFGSTNIYYQGYWNEIANDGSGPGGRNTGGTAPSVSPQVDRHLSGAAGYPLMSSGVRLALGLAPAKSIAYSNQSVTLGNALSLELGIGWDGATSFVVSGLPVDVEVTDSVTSGNVIGSGARGITVQAINDAGTESDSFILEILSGIPNKTNG